MVLFHPKNDEGDSDEADVEKGLKADDSQTDEETWSSNKGAHGYSERGAKVFLVLIILVGVFAASLFLGLGLSLAKKEQDQLRLASELVKEIEQAWVDYMLHQACRSRMIDRQEFRELYEHLRTGGLDFQAAEFIPNITHDERQAF